MEYPFRYDKPNVGDECWFLSQTGPVKSKIVGKHDNYYNRSSQPGKQEDYLIEYWIDCYPQHGLIFGNDLFESEQECLDVMDAYPTVFTNGCFDLIHIGHIRLLKYASTIGKVIVGLNSDKSVRKIKPGRPIQNQNDRKEILESIQWVDEVILFDEETPIELLKQLKPNILVKGGDWKDQDDETFDFVRSYGGEVRFFDYIQNNSTTDIILKMINLRNKK